MDRTIIPVVILVVGFSLFILGIKKIVVHSFDRGNTFDSVASIFLRTFDAVVSILIYALEYKDVIAVLAGLSLMILGISTLHLR